MARIIDEAALDVVRMQGVCDICRAAFSPLHAHHVMARGSGSGSRLDHPLNLLGLDPTCHRLVHDGNIPRFAVWCCAAQRHGLTVNDLQGKVYALLRGEG